MTAQAVAPAAPTFAGTPEEPYTKLLARLQATESRPSRADILDMMAVQADITATELFGLGARDTDSDPLGWAETSTLLARLAAAERGLVLTVACPEDRDDTRPWEELADAANPGQYAAALAAAMAQLGDSVPAAAITRLAAAAEACGARRTGIESAS